MVYQHIYSSCMFFCHIGFCPWYNQIKILFEQLYFTHWWTLISTNKPGPSGPGVKPMKGYLPCYIRLTLFQYFVYHGLCDQSCSYKDTRGRLYSPNFLSTTWEIAILDVRSLRRRDSLWLTQPYWVVRTTEPTNQKTAKRSVRGQIMSMKSPIIFHDPSSNELPLNFWIHIFWILPLLFKINGQPIHYVASIPYNIRTWLSTSD